MIELILLSLQLQQQILISIRFSKALIGSTLQELLLLFLMLLPGLVYYIIFRYGPMYGLVTAFQYYSPFLGMEESPWAGMVHFERLFSNKDFWQMFGNTLRIGALELLIVFPSPIIFALILNEIRQERIKKVYQTISYLPHFLSVVIVCSIFINLFSYDGLVSKIAVLFGGEAKNFLMESEYYDLIYQLSTVWASFGSSSIVYLAALSGVDQQLYEAADLDGCSRMKKIWKITIPSIMPTIVIMFLLQVGNIIRIAPDKTLLLYQPSTYNVADIIASYVYRVGIETRNYSYASAVGLFESVLAAVILFVTNWFAKKKTGTSLW